MPKETKLYQIDVGYVRDNIWVISRLANAMKNKATPEQLITFSTNILKVFL